MRQHTSHLSKQSSDAGPWPRRTTEAANISRAGCTKQWTTQSSVQCCALHSGTCSQQSDKPATHTKRHNAKPCMCASDKTVHRTVMIVHHERPPPRGHRQYTGSGRLGVPTWVDPLLCAPSMPPTSHIHTTNAPHSSQMCHSQSVSARCSTRTAQSQAQQHTGWRSGHPPSVSEHTPGDKAYNTPRTATYMRKKLMVHVKAARLLGVRCASAAADASLLLHVYGAR
jgi:hypothetical protein